MLFLHCSSSYVYCLFQLNYIAVYFVFFIHSAMFVDDSYKQMSKSIFSRQGRVICLQIVGLHRIILDYNCQFIQFYGSSQLLATDLKTIVGTDSVATSKTTIRTPYNSDESYYKYTEITDSRLIYYLFVRNAYQKEYVQTRF